MHCVECKDYMRSPTCTDTYNDTQSGQLQNCAKCQVELDDPGGVTFDNMMVTPGYQGNKMDFSLCRRRDERDADKYNKGGLKIEKVQQVSP